MKYQTARSITIGTVVDRVLRKPGLRLFACLMLGVLAPAPAFAHVKWFADEDSFPLRTDLIVSDRTLFAVIAAVFAVSSFLLLERRLGDTAWPNLAIFRRMAAGAPTILAVQAAIGLVAAAAHNTLVVPNMPLPATPLGVLVVVMELGIALTFITGMFDWFGALGLMALLPLGAMLCDPWDVAEQALWFGIAAFVLVIGRGSPRGGRARSWWVRRNPAWTQRAVTALRVSTGVAFIAVGFGEKVWNPELGRAFVIAHPTFNFLHASLGLSWFSDDLFVLAIGLTEVALGALLVSGRLTRLVVLAMWLPFHVGLPLLPAQELIGHLPIFGIMYLLLVHDSGARQPIARMAHAPRTSTRGVRRLALAMAALFVRPAA